MGVCLLGDYEQVSVPPPAMSSALALLAWKQYKEVRSAYAERPHPFPNGDDLVSVAGHRDGCNTLCPGKNVYQMLDSIRYEVQELLDKCPQVASINQQKPKVVRIAFGPEFKIIGPIGETYRYRITDVSGKTVSSGQLQSGEIKNPETSASGLYILQITDSRDKSHIFKLIR
jgi:hypothetical protein